MAFSTHSAMEPTKRKGRSKKHRGLTATSLLTRPLVSSSLHLDTRLISAHGATSTANPLLLANERPTLSATTVGSACMIDD